MTLKWTRPPLLWLISTNRCDPAQCPYRLHCYTQSDAGGGRAKCLACSIMLHHVFPDPRKPLWVKWQCLNRVLPGVTGCQPHLPCVMTLERRGNWGRTYNQITDPNLHVFTAVTVTLSRQEIYITPQGSKDTGRAVVMVTDPYMAVRIG